MPRHPYSFLRPSSGLSFAYRFLKPSSFSVSKSVEFVLEKMMQPLYALVFGEVTVILLLLFRTPLRKPLLMLLDKLKQGRGPVVASTAGGTLFVIMVSILININQIQNRSVEAGAVNPTDQILLATHLLEASLLGFTLFLALMIDRIHYYIKEVRTLRKHLEAVKKFDEAPANAPSKGKDKLIEDD